MIQGELGFVGCGTKVEFSGAPDWHGDHVEFRFGNSVWIVISTAQAISLKRELENYLLRMIKGENASE